MIEVKRLFGTKVWIALPFTDHCSILYSEVKYKSIFLKKMKSLCKKHLIPPFKIRMFDLDDNNMDTSKYLIHILKLDNQIDEIFKNFSTSLRNQVRQAEKRNLEIRVCQDYNSLLIFYYLHLKTRQKLGVPIQPKNFFIKMYENLISKKLGKIFLVYLGNKPIASAIFLHFKKTLVYKYSASDIDYIKFRPNNFLLWEAIKWGVDNGYKELDFGRTSIKNEGLLRFKRGWGTDEYLLNYITFPEKSVNIESNKIEKYSKLIIQNSPTFVSRISGELLYKYFA